MSGAFDSFNNFHRAQFFQVDERQVSFVEKLIKFGQAFQAKSNSQQVNMFDAFGDSLKLAEPTIPESEKWSNFELLTRKKKLLEYIFLVIHYKIIY